MTSLAVFLHTLDPYAIELWDNGPIRWYGLSYLLGFLLAYLLIRRVTRAGVSTLQPQHVGDLIVTLAIGVVVGGRLGYVLFYDPRLLLTFSHRAPWWGLLAINQGGMASHGGMIGAIVASYVYARRHRHRWAHVLDLAAFGTPIGLCFGRLANFVNGELYGRAVAPDSIAMRWAVRFPQEMFDWFASGPDGRSDARLAQLAPALKYLPTPPGYDSLTVDSYRVQQIIAAVQNGNAHVRAVVEPLLTPRHPSQLYQSLLEGLLLALVLAVVWARPRKPMVVGGWFCAGYGVMRIVGELFRMPDAQIIHEEFARFGVTRGQWLSFLLLLAGLAMIFFARRGGSPPMGGWRRQA